MQQLDGRAMAADVLQECKSAAADLHADGVAPTLAIVRFGEDDAAGSYLRSILRAADAVGVRCVQRSAAADAGTDDLMRIVDELDEDPAVHGVLIESPLPAGVDAGRLDEHLSPRKDIDGTTAASAGRLLLDRPDGHVPATAAAIVELLDRAGVPIRGAHAVVVGRSNVVGKPAAALLLRRDATVTVCHLETVDLPALTRQADILVVAIGSPRFIGPEYVKPGAVVVDVGINFAGGRLIGDVDFDAVAGTAAAITPVPGGVGPLTTAMLLRNVLRAAGVLISHTCHP